MIPSLALFSRRFRLVAAPSTLFFFSLVPLVAGCSSASPPPCEPSAGTPPAGTSPATADAARSPADAEKQVAAVLDDWHDAAAKADENRYFGHLTEDSVFMGTDATERWDKKAFRAYASPHFAKNDAWSFRAARRAIIVGGGGDVAWFDEDLETDSMGPARGAGVLVRTAQGWKIAHYNLTVPIPNDRFKAVKALIAAPPPATTGGK